MTTATDGGALAPEFLGNTRAGPASWSSPRRLRWVPAAGQPGDGSMDDALRLGREMRLRLLAAVRALLADESLVGLGDAARLSAVVLYAKSRAPKGRKDDNQTSIKGPQLGRWLGMNESTVHHKVLPALRGSGALRTRVVTDAEGQVRGLDCLVMPLWNARKGGGAAHPLALSKAELAVLLRLIETLFSPGWTLEDGSVIPAGLLAGRTGKGAATDRLGLLMMMLNTRASGWLQLCAGSVKSKEGRGAATLARLLGCTPSGARKVLARLTEAEVVARGRKATETRMRGRGRVMLLPVAQAYGRVLAPVEASSGPETILSQRPDGAVGDHAPDQGAAALGTSGLCGAEAVERAGDRERPDGAELHADHACVVTPVVPPQLSSGFSGEVRGGEGRRPERACVREGQSADAAAASAPPVAEVGPLRGERPKESPVDERDGQRAGGAGAGGRQKPVGWDKAQRQRRVGLPADLRVRVALGPVAGLWERLSGWQQDQVEAAAQAELTRLAGMLMRPEMAPQLLADRFTDRLEETGGEALVDRPYPWLTRRGLVQRQACSDRRCDDGIRLDTGGDCENCHNVVHIRRARRAKIAAEVDRQLPGLTIGERRQVLDERLQEQAAIEAESFVCRREQARAEQARRDAARAAAQERTERERQAAAAADAVRQALPCEDRGQGAAAGLCEACGYRRRTEALIVEAGLVAAAALNGDGDGATVTADVRASLEADIERARRHLLELVEPGELDTDPALRASAFAFNALQTVEQALPEYRSSALGRLGRTRTARTPSSLRPSPPTPPGSAPRSTCWRRGWSSCASRSQSGPRRPCPRRGRTGSPGSSRVHWTLTWPGR
ncbi:hypothetical protein [Streptomyces sp. NBC_01445]|uniref:hypothetical protein n=1 Tax=Streptomyces sp. NBC_01445 TaxID=2903869 RepID=UPI002DDA2F87|nr:hypothetical protein [Streptomyces sp. NBC_01445]WSE02098.1 hypothetical protein OG574_00835 [Streptomyces sp. NBC_01445]WSE10231.1 hypothetical protein OG574_47175 [Streptomyces sp. NBC_01445]WSE11199.1 hypothetical protein OG574_48845 [Streptomyces sp. NBC_01445]